MFFFLFRKFQKREIERLKDDLTKQINRFEQEKTELQKIINQQEQLTNQIKIQLNIIEKEKENLVQQLQTTLSQLYSKLEKKVFNNKK